MGNAAHIFEIYMMGDCYEYIHKRNEDVDDPFGNSVCFH